MSLPSPPRWAALLLALTCSSCWNTRLASGKAEQLPQPQVDGARRTGVVLPGARPGTAIRKHARLELIPLPSEAALFLRCPDPHSPPLPRHAQVNLALPVGHRGHPEGLAALAALSLCEAPDSARSRPSLHEAVRQLGGNLSVRVGQAWTRIDLQVPRDRWPQALGLLAQRLQAPDTDPAQLRRLREDLIEGMLLRWREDPASAELERWQKSPGLSREQLVQRLDQRSLAEVRLFQARHYQPKGAALGIQVPGALLSDALRGQARDALIPWQPAPVPPPIPVVAETDPDPRPIHWLPDTGPETCVLILPLPDLRPTSRLLLAAFCGGGNGGRLRRELQRQIGAETPEFRLRLGGDLATPVAYLRCHPGPHAAAIWKAAEKSWNQLVHLGPAGEDYTPALRQARLALAIDLDQDSRWFDGMCRQLLAGSTDGPDAELKALAHPADLKKTQTAWRSHEPRMLLVGGKLPDALRPRTRRLSEKLPTWTRAPQLDAAANEAAAAPHLARAIQALGGRAALARVRGYDTEETWSDAGDRLALRVATIFESAGSLRRAIQVGDQQLLIDADLRRGRERLGRDERALGTAETRSLILEGARHPLSLLGQTARGELRWQMLGTRQRHGRPLVLLQRIAPDLPALRIAVDRDSGLCRLVETEEQRPGRGLVRIREEYSDYRRLGSLRVPFHRLQTLGTAEQGTDCTTLRFKTLSRR